VVTIPAGQSAQVQTSFAMPSGMGGAHQFEWTVVSNAAGAAPKLVVKAEYPTP